MLYKIIAYPQLERERPFKAFILELIHLGVEQNSTEGLYTKTVLLDPQFIQVLEELASKGQLCSNTITFFIGLFYETIFFQSLEKIEFRKAPIASTIKIIDTELKENRYELFLTTLPLEVLIKKEATTSIPKGLIKQINKNISQFRAHLNKTLSLILQVKTLPPCVKENDTYLDELPDYLDEQARHHQESYNENHLLFLTKQFISVCVARGINIDTLGMGFHLYLKRKDREHMKIMAALHQDIIQRYT